MSTNTTNTALSADALAAEVPCACRAVLVDGEDSGCQRTTKRTFAPGHDAQLKSRLIRAEVAGSTVAWASDPETAVSVAEVAGSHGFGYLVTAGVVRAHRQQQEKADRKAARDAVREANAATRAAAKAQAQAKRGAAKAAKADRPAKRGSEVAASAKVGRWVYQGQLRPDGVFVYETKKGGTKKAVQGAYELVAK